MIEIAGRSRIRAAPRRAESQPIAFLLRLDWVLMAATFALIGAMLEA